MASILVIDDDQQIRSVLRIFLERSGHTVRQAGDGEEGLRLFGAESPSLVLCDLHMARKHGLDTLRELRRLDPAARLVALSGDPRALAVAKTSGVDAVLAKPFSRDSLTRCVDDVLARPGA
jgi:CheY-like chemotaxis protein